jgi:hypothetical protein
MVVGTLVAAAGVALLARLGPGSTYVVDVLPAATLLGLGLSLVVAPLTATVLASADPRRAGIASGVNNAIARAAQLLAVAGLPLLVGLSGDDYHQPAVFTHGFGQAMVICAGLMLAGSALSLFTIGREAVTQPVPRFCGVEGTPLRPAGHSTA